MSHHFPYSFGSPVSDPTRIGQMLASNFAKAATESYVDKAVAGVSAGTGAHTHPISDVTNLQPALDGKQPLDADLTAIAGLDSGTSAGVMATEATGWVKRTYAQVKTSLGLVKGDVGLANVDNTSDLAKPVSTATQAALDAKAPLASPALTGTPTAPTATAGTSTTQLATTAFVQSSITAGTGIQATIVDAKGDLIVGTGPDAVARQGVGANGTVLTADNSQAGGVVWAPSLSVAWTDLSYAAAWSARTDSYGPPKVSKSRNGIVRMRGLAIKASGSGGGRICFLPIGLRPPISHIFACPISVPTHGDAVAHVYIHPGGEVDLGAILPAGSAAPYGVGTGAVNWLSLSTISFDVTA